MKLKQYKELDWDKASVLEWKYLDYLQKMINERLVGNVQVGYYYNFDDTQVQLGMNPIYIGFGKVTARTETQFCWNTMRFSPGGFVKWEQLQSIYSMVMYLATYVYINEDNFKNENFVNGDNRKLFGYSMEQLNTIAEFNFFTNPFIPGQPILYYNKFLKPLYLILKSLNKVWSNQWKTTTTGASGSVTDSVFNVKDEDDNIDTPASFKHFQHPNNWKSGIENHSLTSVNTSKFLYYMFQLKWYESKNVNISTIERCSWRHGDVFRFRNMFKPGSKYDIYLYSTTYIPHRFNPGFPNYSGKISIPFYYRSNWNNIIKRQSGTVPDTGIVTEIITLPDFNWNFTYPVSDSIIKKYYFDSTNDKVNYNIFNRRCHVGAAYIPMIIVDYTGTWKYN